MHVWKRFLLKLRLSRRAITIMHRLPLRIVVAIVTFVLGVLASGVWIVYHFSPVGTPLESHDSQSSPYGASLSEIPTVNICNLLAQHADFNQKVIRTQADLFSYDNHVTLADPSSCTLPDPMIGLDIDPSLQYDSSDESQREVIDLLRSESVHKYRRFRVTIVGRFEGPIFSRNTRRSKYPFWLVIIRLEKAAPFSSAIH